MTIDAFVSSEKLWEYCMQRHILEVCGVFSQGVYFKGEDGQIMMLYDESKGTLAFGLAAKAFAGKGRELGLENAMQAKMNQGSITVPEAGLFITLNKVCVPQITVKAPNKHELIQLKNSLLCELKSNKPSSLLCLVDSKDYESDDIFVRFGQRGILKLREGMEGMDEAAIEQGLKGVLGLGRGLTPSFDDFICGMIFSLNYACRLWGYSLPEAKLVCNAVLTLAHKQTNIFSAAYLISAAKGEHFSFLSDCLLNDNLNNSVKNLLSIGASSGADMLAGIVYALRYITER